MEERLEEESKDKLGDELGADLEEELESKPEDDLEDKLADKNRTRCVYVQHFHHGNHSAISLKFGSTIRSKELPWIDSLG